MSPGGHGTAPGVLKLETRAERGKLLDGSELRRIMRHWVSGVAVVSARTPEGRPCGLTASAVTSVSLDPPLALVCVDRTSDTHGCILAAGHFALSLLAREQEALAYRFAASADGDKFAGLASRQEVTGAPLLEGALAWLDCRLWQCYEGGDHSIFVGEVLAGGAREGTPLVYHQGVIGRPEES